MLATSLAFYRSQEGLSLENSAKTLKRSSRGLSAPGSKKTQKSRKRVENKPKTRKKLEKLSFSTPFLSFFLTPGTSFQFFFVRSSLGRGLFDSCRRPTMSQANANFQGLSGKSLLIKILTVGEALGKSPRSLRLVAQIARCNRDVRCDSNRTPPNRWRCERVFSLAMRKHIRLI